MREWKSARAEGRRGEKAEKTEEEDGRNDVNIEKLAHTCTTLLPILLRDDFDLKQHRNIDPKQNTKFARPYEKYDKHAQPQKQTLLPIPCHKHYRDDHSNIAATCTCVHPLLAIWHAQKKGYVRHTRSIAL